ncbi:MAG: carboxylate--amine ligase [Eggerthellaceae bacterium]|nr:carboxylate--amine ligase [Eggerthellaceae bacterium]
MKADYVDEGTPYAQEYLDILRDLDGDEAGRRAAWERMAAGTAYYHGEPVAFDYLPRFYGPRTRAYLDDVVATTYGILAKVIRRYQDDPAFQAEFRFDPRVEELVMLPRGYDEPLPVARFDFMFDDATGGFRFCEFNTDSSSGMNETREALAALRPTPTFQRFAAHHRLGDDVARQFDGWVDTFARIYRDAQAGGAGAPAGESADAPGAAEARAAARAGASPAPTAAPGRPRVAIVACLDGPHPDASELALFVPLFERAGFACSVFNVGDLSFDGEHLHGGAALAGEGDVDIDVVWRFCIVVDLLAHWDAAQPLVEALRARKVEMIGSFATQVAHDKQLFAVLRRPAAQALLTPEERRFVDEHIPFTAFLDDPALDVDEVRRHPEHWVLKPTDWYASKNVVAGAETAPDEWSRLIDERLAQRGGSPWLVQEFFPPRQTPAVPLYGRPEDFTADPRPFGNLMGLYSYAGRCAGAYLRQGPHDVIGSARAGLVAPVLWVTDEDPAR